jgi:hypothetical protein
MRLLATWFNLWLCLYEASNQSGGGSADMYSKKWRNVCARAQIEHNGTTTKSNHKYGDTPIKP